MKRDPYLDRFIKLLEATATRAHKDLERERKRVDFIEGKVERLELVVMAAKSDAGREYAERTDRAAEATAPRRPSITKVSANGAGKLPFSDVREKWNSMTTEEQEEAIAKQNLQVEGKERPA